MQTALGCSGSAFTSILLLISGLIYASIQMQDSGEKLSGSIVPMPMIGMSRKQGPWPKCVGMTGSDCSTYIESNADNLHITIVEPNDEVISDFDQDRVLIFIDDDGIVSAIPSRG